MGIYYIYVITPNTYCAVYFPVYFSTRTLHIVLYVMYKGFYRYSVDYLSEYFFIKGTLCGSYKDMFIRIFYR